MTSEANAGERHGAASSESRALASLRRAYEARGFTFLAEPPQHAVPDFLGTYRPDAIARGPEGGVIIEVKRGRRKDAEDALADVARRVAGQRGWEFRVIYVNPVQDEPDRIERPTRQQVQAALGEVGALIESGHRTAAFALAWAALEALARLAGSEGAEKERAFAPMQAVQMLAEEGYIESDAAARLRGMVKLRHAVIHGDLSAEVSTEQVKGMLDDLRQAASGMEAAA
jgi:hypothetical protein